MTYNIIITIIIIVCTKWIIGSIPLQKKPYALIAVYWLKKGRIFRYIDGKTVCNTGIPQNFEIPLYRYTVQKRKNLPVYL